VTEPAAAQAATPPAPAPTPPPATPPAAAPTATPAAQPATPPAQPPVVPTAEDYAKLQADLASWQAQARKHEDRWKARDEQNEQQSAALRLIAEKVGVDLEGKPDPAKLAERLTAVQAEANQRAVELAVFRAAAAAGANADLLLDSRAFMAKAGALDPSAADFTDQVKAAAAEAVTANPTFAVAKAEPAPAAEPQPAAQPQLPAASGADFSGAPSGDRQWTDDDVARATPQQLSKAIEQGLLANMGIAPPRQRRR
jgi:hypothetical protein